MPSSLRISHIKKNIIGIATEISPADNRYESMLNGMEWEIILNWDLVNSESIQEMTKPSPIKSHMAQLHPNQKYTSCSVGTTMHCNK